MLNNIKNNQKGFTIVELLIVIVVIAILAAISIVAYNGIQNRGKASSAQSLANIVTKKAEAYNTVESGYPTYTQLNNNTGAGTATNPPEAKLDNNALVTDAGAAAAALTVANEKTVQYKKCATGAAVYYFDATTGKINTVGIGGQASVTTAAAGANPTACS